MSEKKLVIMRGLPWTGKSFTAKEVLEKADSEGRILSTDDYWYEINKPDKPDEYSFNHRLLGKAHGWNQQRSFRLIEEGFPLIIIDNTNTTYREFSVYVEYAVPQNYKVLVQEPTSDRWQEIVSLLANTRANKKELKSWAKTLEEGSKETHNVPAWAIEKMMWRWEPTEDIEFQIREIN